MSSNNTLVRNYASSLWESKQKLRELSKLLKTAKWGVRIGTQSSLPALNFLSLAHSGEKKKRSWFPHILEIYLALLPSDWVSAVRTL